MAGLKEILELEQTKVEGTFPDGKLGDDDGGALMVGVATRGKLVTVVFAKPTDVLAMPAELARTFARHLLDHADMAERSN